MVTLGQLVGSLVKGNPRIIVMSTETLKAGVPVEINGIKIAMMNDEQVIVLTI